MKTQPFYNIKDAKNIGVTIAKHLNEIGVFSLSDLAHMTSIEAYQSICKQHPNKTFPICYYLYSLEAALLDIHWCDLPKELRRELRKQVNKKGK